MHAIVSRTLWLRNLILEPIAYKNPEKPLALI